MTINFSNLTVKAKRLWFSEVMSLDKRLPAGMFQELNDNIVELNIENLNADSVEDLKLCFSSNKIEVLEFRACSFNSVTSLLSRFFGNTRLKKVIVNNNYVADDIEPDRTHRISKELALFPSADKISGIFTSCQSIRYLNFEPLFGQEYTISQATDAIANTNELITLNFGGLTFNKTEPDDVGKFEDALNHLILHNCCDSLEKYYIDTRDKFTKHKLKKYFDEVLEVRQLMNRLQ